jgi:glycosyltransferase involved in cell wall biosynthesis
MEAGFVKAVGALDVSVVVPTRNAERLIDSCLASIVASRPREIILVDGVSTDRTVELAQRHPVTVLSDGGAGLPAARLIGARAARSRWVALVDADIVLPDGALATLVDEAVSGGYTALQAGLQSVAGSGYWGQALVQHHRSGRSRHWFGVAATVFERQALLRYGFDSRFRSGEDIELRHRLERAGVKIGVSRATVVIHRFEDSFAFARGQWLADGHGLARLLRKHRWRVAWVVILPLAASMRGVVFALFHRQPKWIPYYAAFVAFNYMGMLRELLGRADGEAEPA